MMEYFKFYINTKRNAFSLLGCGALLFIGGFILMESHSLIGSILGILNLGLFSAFAFVLLRAQILSYIPEVVYNQEGFYDKRILKKAIPSDKIESFQIIHKKGSDFLEVTTIEKLDEFYLKFLFRNLNKDFRKNKNVKITGNKFNLFRNRFQFFETDY